MINKNSKKLEEPLSKILRFIFDFPVSLLLAGNLFLFIPFAIYRGNLDEFSVSLSAILKSFFLPALLLLLVFQGIGLLLKENKYKRYLSIVFILGLLIWLQGNILVWDYGLLGKSDIDWSSHTWRGWVDGTLWLALLTVGYFFYKSIYKLASFTALVLFILQMLSLSVLSFQKPEIWDKKLVAHSPPKELFAFSAKQNVIHIILDELQSSIFKEIIDNDANRYYGELKGFTFFQDTAGSFPTTVMSIPAFLSERIYENDEPIKDFIDSAYKGNTIPNMLFDKGYTVDLAASLGWYRLGNHATWYYIPVPYRVTKSKFEKSSAEMVGKLVFYRSMPHFLAKAFNTGTLALPALDLDSNALVSYEAQRHFAHKEFLQDMIDNMYISGNKPIYKFLHLNTPHYPAVLNNAGEYAGRVLPWTWPNIRIQAKFSFDHAMRFVQKLKELEIYDSSLIILQADHGYWKIEDSFEQFQYRNVSDNKSSRHFGNNEHFAKVACSSAPLLAIKPPYSNGPLMISNAQTMLTDLPATINSVLNLGENFNGRSVFEINENETRTRVFYYYDKLNRAEDDYFDRMYKYAIRGNLFDLSSWSLEKTIYPKGSYYRTEKIDFGTSQASKFLRSGWSAFGENSKEGTTYNWALGKEASVFLSIPEGNAEVTVTSKSPFPPGEQVVTVKVDGKEVGRWQFASAWKWEKHKVTIPRDKKRPDFNVVEFNFSKFLDPQREGQDKRPLAVLFESLSVNESDK